ncbi:MAG: hypothetical protein Q8P93_03600 [bacterium]|nr:hypothetical protein [bacterium]
MNTARNYISQVIDERASIERMMLGILVALVVVLSVLYMYFVAHAAYAISDTGLYSHQTAQAQSQLAGLESRYLASRSKVTSSSVSEFGLVFASSVVYAPTPIASGLSLDVR